MLTVSGSKSQPGSGVPAAASANKSDNVVNAPSVTFRQKSAPSAALKVAGSHSSKATTCAALGDFSCSSSIGMAPANIEQAPSKPNFAKVIFIIVLRFSKLLRLFPLSLTAQNGDRFNHLRAK